jgi:hypothetical protein
MHSHEWLVRHMHWIRRDQQRHLREMLRGFYQYFRLHHCQEKLDWIRREVQRQWRRTLRQQSQRHRLHWSYLASREWFKLPLPPKHSLHPTVLTAPAYSERRSGLAKQLGLGRGGRTSGQAPEPVTPETPAAPQTQSRRRRRPQSRRRLRPEGGGQPTRIATIADALSPDGFGSLSPTHVGRAQTHQHFARGFVLRRKGGIVLNSDMAGCKTRSRQANAPLPALRPKATCGGPPGRSGS